MAKRPIFVPDPNGSLVIERNIEFEWFPGQAPARKQLNIQSLHTAARSQYECDTLEISTKSLDQLGVSLSAFRLTIQNPEYDRPLLLEAAYQGSKILAETGHLTHLYEYQSGGEIKNYLNSRSEEQLLGFKYAGHEWPLTPQTAFYDWLYVTAVHQSLHAEPEAKEQLSHFDAFSDIEYNPQRALNCQARACALYVALSTNHLLPQATETPQSFLKTLQDFKYGERTTQPALEL